MSAKKTERLQRQAEERIGQYKAVVDYLAKKTDVATIPLTNQATIVDVLIQGGWTQDGELFLKGDKRLNLIEAGKVEFKEQYLAMRRDHLLSVVRNFTDG